MKVILGVPQFIYMIISTTLSVIFEILIVYPVKYIIRCCKWIKFTVFNPVEGFKAFIEFWQRQYNCCLDEANADNFFQLVIYLFFMSLIYFFVMIIEGISGTSGSSVGGDIGVRNMFIVIALDLIYFGLIIMAIDRFLASFGL